MVRKLLLPNILFSKSPIFRWRVHNEHAIFLKSLSEEQKESIEKEAKPITRIRLVVGLGNPGKKYEKTRHNVGFDVLDRLADKLGFEYKTQARWQLHEGRYQDVFFIKPQTFMNESGRAVGAVCRFYKIRPEEVLVVYDDVSHDPGIIRFKMSGSAGGHNGIKSLIQHLGTQAFPRLKIGVGKSTKGGMVGHVLGTFREEECEDIEKALESSAEAVQLALKQGTTAAANVYNVRKPTTDTEIQDE